MATLVSDDGRVDEENNPIHTESNYNSTEEALAQAKHDMAMGQRIVVCVIADDGTKITAKKIKRMA